MISYASLINKILRLIKTSEKLLDFKPPDNDAKIYMRFLQDVYGYTYGRSEKNEQLLTPFKKNLQKIVIPQDHKNNSPIIAYWQGLNEANFIKKPIFDQSGRLVPFIERRHEFFHYIRRKYPKLYPQYKESYDKYLRYHTSMFSENFILINTMEMIQNIQKQIKPTILLKNRPIENAKNTEVQKPLYEHVKYMRNIETKEPSYLFYVKYNKDINMGVIQVSMNEVNIYTENNILFSINFSFIHNINYNVNEQTIEEFETIINNQMSEDQIESNLNNFSSQVVSEINKAYNLMANNQNKNAN